MTHTRFMQKLIYIAEDSVRFLCVSSLLIYALFPHYTQHIYHALRYISIYIVYIYIQHVLYSTNDKLARSASREISTQTASIFQLAPKSATKSRKTLSAFAVCVCVCFIYMSTLSTSTLTLRLVFFFCCLFFFFLLQLHFF